MKTASKALVPIMRDAIDTTGATLPGNYEKARTAIATCQRIDECKDWADKAKALASYAKQANDDTLWQMATRIQMRASRRCGELLAAIAPHPGGRPKTRDANGPSFSRARAAFDAGLSERQRKTVLRVASVSKEEFEEAVESDAPPTLTEMAERGTKTKTIEEELREMVGDRDPEEYKAATHILGGLEQLAKELAPIDPEAIVRGSNPREWARMLRDLSAILPWLHQLESAIKKEIP